MTQILEHNRWLNSNDFHTRMTGPKRFLQILTDKV